MRLTAIAACLCLIAPAAGAAGDLDPINFPIENGGVDFTMPSNNVECVYSPRGGTATYRTSDGLAELSCDRLEPSYVRVYMGEKGMPSVLRDVGDQFCCSDNHIFPYGRSWHMPPFTCESLPTGLRCERDDGHGFTISKAKIKTY